jgi:hypothetical protein
VDVLSVIRKLEHARFPDIATFSISVTRQLMHTLQELLNAADVGRERSSDAHPSETLAKIHKLMKCRRRARNDIFRNRVDPSNPSASF